MLVFLLPAVGGRAWRRMGIRRTSPAPTTVRSPPSLAEEFGGQRQFAATMGEYHVFGGGGSSRRTAADSSLAL